MPIAHVLTETAFHTPTDSPTAKKQVITEAENTKLAPPAKHWDYGVLPVASAAAWLVGACAFLLHFCVSHIRAFWFLGSLRSSSVPWGGAEICSICSPLHRDPLPEGAKLPSWSFSLLNIFSAKVSNIRVVLSHRTKIPFTFGLFRPVMVFPAEAANWPAEKVEAVFLHEKAHMVRRDLFWQNTVHVTKCFYWFHPFVRFLARRVQVEQELACDDMVLQNGRRGFAGDYAGILLELAQSLSFQDN